MDFLPHMRMMGIAPELPGASELAEKLSAAGVVVSIAHSDATYDDIKDAVRRGFSDVTHIYSGCSTVVRRDAFRVSGVVEAGLEMDELTVQAIADGRHLPPELLRLIYRAKGADGMYAITDALEFAASRIDEGAAYTQLNGMSVLYEDGVMKLPDRSAFAGSVATMSRAVNVLVGAGIALTDAVRMATGTPATRIGALHKGRVASGYDADLILFDDDINVRLCMVAGDIHFGREYIQCA
jgi:N-acetylglucosamine-6-phosphate deacetylase